VITSSPGRDAGGDHGAVQPGGAGRNADGVAAAGELGDRALELLEPRADRERAAVQHVDDGVDFILRDIGLRQRDRRWHRVGSTRLDRTQPLQPCASLRGTAWHGGRSKLYSNRFPPDNPDSLQQFPLSPLSPSP
jgi:hypothetical protein